MKIKIHSQGIKGSSMVVAGEEANVLFNGVLEIDGLLIDHLESITVKASGDEMLTVEVVLIPGSVEVVPHNKDSWAELLERLER